LASAAVRDWSGLEFAERATLDGTVLLVSAARCTLSFCSLTAPSALDFRLAFIVAAALDRFVRNER
jgi:hypothetical protein